MSTMGVLLFFSIYLSSSSISMFKVIFSNMFLKALCTDQAIALTTGTRTSPTNYSIILYAYARIAAPALPDAPPDSNFFCVSVSMALRTRVDERILVFISEMTRLRLKGISVWNAHLRSEKYPSSGWCCNKLEARYSIFYFMMYFWIP